MPIEIKRKRGTDRPDRTPREGELVTLQAGSGRLPYPADLGLAGRRFWDQCWDAAVVWLSPMTDALSIEQTCQVVDDIAEARTRYRATRDPADARALVALDKQLQSWLSSLGFNPTARARLGVAEVKAASTIDKLLERRQRRQEAG